MTDRKCNELTDKLASAAVAALDERVAYEAWAISEGINIASDEDGYVDRIAERTSAAWQTRADLASEGIEELHQLGYTFRDGRLIPPDHMGELMAVVQASACGCQYGTCETKANSACRMRAEITGKRDKEL